MFVELVLFFIMYNKNNITVVILIYIEKLMIANRQRRDYNNNKR